MAFVTKSFDEQTEETKFNFGLDLLKRISMEFYTLEESLVYGDYTLAYNMIQTINNELDAFLTNNERLSIIDIEKKINEIFNQCNVDEIFTYDFQGKKISKYQYPNERIKLKPLLIELDRKFRSLMKDKGLYMPPKSESGLF